MTRVTRLGWVGSFFIIPLCGGCLVPQPAGKGKRLHLAEPQTKTSYYLYLPEDYVKTNGKRADGRKWPLVMTFHGMKPFDTYDRQINEWQEESDRYGFITCAPLMSHASVLDTYPLNRETKAFQRDVKNILAVMEDVFRRTEADPTRVLSTGWSEGGYMAHYLVNRYPAMFSCLAVKQCNFSSEIVDAARAARYRDMPVAIFYTENDFGICRKESVEAVAWYKRRGFRRLASGVIDSYGHERMPELAADFFAKHCGASPKTPPKQLARIQMSEIPRDALAQADIAPPVSRIRPLPPASVNYADNRRSASERPRRRTPAPVFDVAKPTRRPVPPPKRDARRRQPDKVARETRLPGPPVRANVASADRRRAGQVPGFPRYQLPSYRVPPRPASTPTPRRARGKLPRYTTKPTQADIDVRLSTTIGLSPLLVSFEVRMPAGGLRHADILWMDNGEPIANGPAGRKILREVGEHRIGVLVITGDGHELQDSKVVTVYPRSQVSASGT